MSTRKTSASSAEAPTAAEVWFTMNSLVRDHAAESRARISRVIDIPFSRFRALRRVAIADVTQRDLAARMGVDASAMTGIINDLEALALVERRPHHSDGRIKYVTITEEGVRAVRAVTDDPTVAPPAFSALDDDQLAQLADLLEILRVAAEA